MLTRTDITRITEQLKVFGCNAGEVAIYLQSLHMGSASVQEIARKLRKNRVTVHSAVGQLIEKGLLFETRKGKRRLIVAEEPVGLLRLLQKKENEFRAMRSNLEQMIPLLASVQSTDQSVPSVKLYEGVDGFKLMLEETLSARGDVLVFSDVDLFSALVGPKYLEDYFVRRAAKGIHTRLIFPPCAFADRVNRKSKEYKIRVRLLPKRSVWRSGIFSWNDSLALMSYTEQKLSTTIIENKDIASFYRNVNFELVWNQAEQI